ncbi:galactose-3-O-sulfotransferase 2-like [Amblyraja radiata]|uniref:galactose-3-O-sulfotransferase 2-like n=1 Tax=Amblyraja radiata TaxID=386614 RepID=UPI0014021715|nr:galactose-3-O-sulfotransferase 2-like [Amblyraja radiata]
MFNRWKGRTGKLFLMLVVASCLTFIASLVYLSTVNGYRFSRKVPCTPRKHVAFMKTHKSASSTVLNLLYRYGDAKNLTFALPPDNHLGYPNLFRATFVKGFAKNPGKEYNIICNHMRFNLPEVKKVTGNDSFVFTILRNPDSVAESAFIYCHNDVPAFRAVKTMTEFVRKLDKEFKLQGSNNHLAHNVLWFDLGGDAEAGAEGPHVDQTLKEFDSTFHLVLLAEYFDQSLVLLREALCWDMEDMVSFQLNTRDPSTRSSLPPDLLSTLQRWNALDWHLYRHFNTSFWQRVERYGVDRMERDVKHLRHLSQKIQDICLQSSTPVAKSKSSNYIKSPDYGWAKITGYLLKGNLTGQTKEMCSRMVLPEGTYLNHLKRKQG